MSVILDLSSQQHCIELPTMMTKNPTLSFSIGVARNNRESRYNANNTCLSFVSSLIVGVSSTSEDSGGYKSVLSNDKQILANLWEVSPSVVAYAAAASRQGGNVFQVDDLSVKKFAPRSARKMMGALFVLISALAMYCPDSKSYQITNTLGDNYHNIIIKSNLTSRSKLTWQALSPGS